MLFYFCPLPQDVALGSQPPALIEDIHGTLLDALTGEPLAGAELELWSEEFDNPAVLGDRTLSAVDGTFVLERYERDQEKIRVRAERYRSTVFTDDGAPVYLFPRDEPLRLRILDLDGRPIAGARVRSHQTCRHAPAAVEALSDAGGRVVIADAPPLRGGAEYEIRATGYGALLLDEHRPFEEEPVIHLPRRAEVHVQLLDASGAPLANRRFRQQGPLPTIFVTDGAGRTVLDSLFESRELGVQDCSKEGLFYGGMPPLAGEALLRPGDFSKPQPSDARTLVVQPAEPYSVVHVQFADDSWTFVGDTGRPRPTRSVAIPPSARVTVLEQGRAVRRVELDPWMGARELDMSTAPVLTPAPTEPATVAMCFRAVTLDGEPLAVHGDVRWRGPTVEDSDASPEGVRFDLPEGVRYEARFSAEGHATLHRVGGARESAAAAEEVRLPRRAQPPSGDEED